MMGPIHNSFLPDVLFRLMGIQRYRKFDSDREIYFTSDWGLDLILYKTQYPTKIERANFLPISKTSHKRVYLVLFLTTPLFSSYTLALFL